MSAAARDDFEPTSGNTARTLSGFMPSASALAPGPARERRSRSPLSLVVSQPRKRRTPFVVFCFLTLVAALATVLVLNISVSSGQYQLVELRATQVDLVKTNQDLTQQVQDAQAPQNLVAKATELGMVSSTSMGQIDVETKSVSGTPKAAVAGDKPLVAIAPPAVSGQPEDSEVAPDAKVADVPTIPVTAGGSSKAGATTAPAEVPAAPSQVAAPPAADLNGGTIPAPKQKIG
ncbi:hypothetical protein IV500_18780 [Paeniglutamicibacter antarcticus]|uniref:Cell division protein FtsL n=1 Tax=Arthrobacter terrae TaxID=2935737 RepID=A0A931CMN9_9MICC|nr:hypothetical protein [Arthrobacter terrae]MBG0741412.1 hypothetical protein [Arthrobacter terrae]